MTGDGRRQNCGNLATKQGNLAARQTNLAGLPGNLATRLSLVSGASPANHVARINVKSSRGQRWNSPLNFSALTGGASDIEASINTYIARERSDSHFGWGRQTKTESNCGEILRSLVIYLAAAGRDGQETRLPS